MTEKRVAIVTGAGNGMGLALTQHLVRSGWRVAMCDVNEVQDQANVKQFGDSVIFLQADVAEYDQQAQVFETAWAKWGRLDFVAANAGIAETGSLYDFGGRHDGDKAPPKPNLKTLEVDLVGVTYTIYLANYYMQRSPGKGGCINVTSSGVAFYAWPGMPLYTASKAALPALVRAMAPDLLQHNVRINCLCPGLVKSGLTDAFVNLIPEEHLTSTDDIVQAHRRFIEGDETGRVADISKGKIYLREEPQYVDESQRWLTENLPLLLKKGSK